VLALTGGLLLGAGAPAAAATTQSASCLDGGSTRWSSRVVWGDLYSSADGVRRVTVDYVGWTTSRRGTVRTDSVVKTYDGGGRLLQQLPWTGGFDYRSGGAFRVRNPVNPPSSPGRAKVTVTLGVDGDGYGSCTVTFTQPGAPTTPPPTTPPPPTSTPTTPAPTTPAPPTPAPTTPAPTTPAPTTPAPTTPAPTSPAPSGSPADRYEADVLSATNSERTSRGLVALTAQACVDRYAEEQSARMAAESRMFHQDLYPVLNGCQLNAVAENVAYGYSSGTAVTAGWMGSDGHRANILNARYRLHGVGATQDAQGRWYVAQVFGSTS
jgi:uncharacterized protein YkwD